MVMLDWAPKPIGEVEGWGKQCWGKKEKYAYVSPLIAINLLIRLRYHAWDCGVEKK